MDNSSAARRAAAPDSSPGPRGRRDLRDKDEKTRMRINDALRRVAKLEHRPGAR